MTDTRSPDAVEAAWEALHLELTLSTRAQSIASILARHRLIIEAALSARSAPLDVELNALREVADAARVVVTYPRGNRELYAFNRLRAALRALSPSPEPETKP